MSLLLGDPTPTPNPPASTLAFAQSTVPAFRAALISALEARPALAGVAITDGRPAPNILSASEFVALLDVDGTTAARPFERTSQPRDERYAQSCAISVVGVTRANQTTLGDRAFAILAEIGDQIRSTVRLEGFYEGPGNVYSVTMADWNYITRADDTNREAAIEFTLDVHARI